MSWERLATLWSLIFALDAARYGIGTGLVAWILYRRLARWSETRRVQARRASRADMRREIAYSITTSAVYAALGVAAIGAVRAGVVDQPWRPERMGWGWAMAALPVLLVLHDAYFYWVHRAMHTPLLFRAFHRVHHLSRTPTCFAAYAFAPGEALIMGSFVPLASFLMPVPQVTLFLFMAVMILRNAMGHSGIEFHPRGWIDSHGDLLTTTTHHDLHHQRVNGNYGLYFTWWDRWMGTEFPDYRARFREAAGGSRCDELESAALPRATARPRSGAASG